MKRTAKYLSVMLIMALLISLQPSSLSVKAADYVAPVSGLNVDKTASPYGTPDTDGRQIFKLNITATTESNIIVNPKPCDIILILDNSSSLNGDMQNKIKIKNALKQTAKDFVANVLSNSPDSKIAIINSKPTYAETTSTSLLNVVSGQTILNSAIDDFDTNGAVHLENGLEKAINTFPLIYEPGRPRFVIVVTGKSNWGSTEVQIDLHANTLKTTYHSIIYALGIYDSANSLNQSMWELSSNYPYNTTLPSGYSYPPNVLLPNDAENLYKTAFNSDELNSIFEGIAEETGQTLEDVAIRDYIDPRFNIVNSSGNLLDVGDSITIGGETGIIKQNANGIYIEWIKDKIEPGTLAEGKGFSGLFYIKPKSDFIGGNVVPTNIANLSAIYVEGQSIASLPNPTVNVPFKLNVIDLTDDIFLGEGILKSQEEAQNNMLLLNPDYSYPSSFILYNFNPDFTTDVKPTTDSSYTLTATASPYNYIDFSNTSIWTPLSSGATLIGYTKSTGEIYYLPVGNPATQVSDTGTYYIRIRTGALTITKHINGTCNPNQAFVFEIKLYDDVQKTNLIKTFYETIRVEDNSAARSVISLPKGYYEVKELADWSWQYDINGAQIANATLGMNADGSRNIGKTAASVGFENASKQIKYLNSIDWVINIFSGDE